MNPDAAIQAALYAVLTNDDSLMAQLTGGVWDEPPEDAKRPYLVLQDFVTTPDNDQTTLGHATVATLHVWSSYHGNAEALSIASRVIALLDHQSLAISGHEHIVTRFEFLQTLRDPEKPYLRHVPIRFRIITTVQ